MTGLLCVDAASRKSGVALFSKNCRLISAKAADVASVKKKGVYDKSVLFGMSIARADKMGREIALVADSMSKLVKPARIVIEYPMFYRTGPASRLPGDDILVLAASATAAWVNLAALYPEASVEPVRPLEWKGQVPKRIMNQRVLDRLAPDELTFVEDTENDNILDAIGIGMRICKRM